jgi:cytosine/adenosine deaminase-related metal-dependent hydrolase
LAIRQHIQRDPGPLAHRELEFSRGIERDAATRSGAEFLNKTTDYGTIALGRAADLVLLDANPLEDIRNVRRINAVIFNGRYLGRAALDLLLVSAEAAARRPPGT